MFSVDLAGWKIARSWGPFRTWWQPPGSQSVLIGAHDQRIVIVGATMGTIKPRSHRHHAVT
jgi:hypothetical protein